MCPRGRLSHPAWPPVGRVPRCLADVAAWRFPASAGATVPQSWRLSTCQTLSRETAPAVHIMHFLIFETPH